MCGHNFFSYRALFLWSLCPFGSLSSVDRGLGQRAFAARPRQRRRRRSRGHRVGRRGCRRRWWLRRRRRRQRRRARRLRIFRPIQGYRETPASPRVPARSRHRVSLHPALVHDSAIVERHDHICPDLPIGPLVGAVRVDHDDDTAGAKDELQIAVAFELFLPNPAGSFEPRPSRLGKGLNRLNRQQHGAGAHRYLHQLSHGFLLG